LENDCKEIVKLLKAGNSFLISSHAHPDGDGLGSTLALGIALESMGKDVVMYNEDRVPRSMDFLPEAGKLVSSFDNSKKFDVTIMVDCGQTERAGKDFPSVTRRGTLICIDHHVSGCKEAALSFVDKGAASTGEVIYTILKKMGTKIDSDIATLILTTLIVDTGFFRYSNTNTRTLTLAAELVAEGASTWHISKYMEERVPPQQLKLLSGALDTIDFFLDGKLAIMFLTGQMLEHANAHMEMAEDFINYPRSIDGVEVAVLIREKNHNEYKISFRSKDVIDVAKLVAEFGGGGHKHAAGCTIKKKIGTVRQIIVDTVEKAFNVNELEKKN
jgi:phosphoesterase RecJ-like protein